MFSSFKSQAPILFGELIKFFPDLIIKRNPRYPDYQDLFNVVSIEITANDGVLTGASCSLSPKPKKEIPNDKIVDDFISSSTTVVRIDHKILEEKLKESGNTEIEELLNGEIIVPLTIKWTSKNIIFKDNTPGENPEIAIASFSYTKKGTEQLMKAV